MPVKHLDKPRPSDPSVEMAEHIVAWAEELRGRVEAAQDAASEVIEAASGQFRVAQARRRVD
jgi:hypothetical protein